MDSGANAETVPGRKRDERHALVSAIKSCQYRGPDVAKRLRITDASLDYRLRKHGLKLRPKLHLHTDAEIIMALASSRTQYEAAESFGVSQEYFLRYLRTRGIESPHATGDRTATRKRLLADVSSEVLWDVYRRVGYSMTRAAKRLGVNRTTIWREMERRGIPRVPRTTVHPWDEKILRYLHHNQKLNAHTIGLMYGTTAWTVIAALERYGVERRYYPQARPGSVKRELPPKPQYPPTDDAWEAMPITTAETRKR